MVRSLLSKKYKFTWKILLGEKDQIVYWYIFYLLLFDFYNDHNTLNTRKIYIIRRKDIHTYRIDESIIECNISWNKEDFIIVIYKNIW